MTEQQPRLCIDCRQVELPERHPFTVCDDCWDKKHPPEAAPDDGDNDPVPTLHDAYVHLHALQCACIDLKHRAASEQTTDSRISPEELGRFEEHLKEAVIIVRCALPAGR